MVLVTGDQQPWPLVGDRIEILASPKPGFYGLCRSVRGDADIAHPVASPDQKSAEIGDTGTVKSRSTQPTMRGAATCRVVIDTP